MRTPLKLIRRTAKENRFTPGILSSTGFDYAFDFASSKGSFFYRDGEWHRHKHDVLYADWRKHTRYELREPWTGSNFKESQYPACDTVKRLQWNENRHILHASEDDWNLPTTHPRHVLNFPQEILDRILTHLLVADTGMQLSPIFKEYNPVNNTPIFEYRLIRGEMPVTTCFMRRHDSRGEYWEDIKVERAVIDATCLRVCKKLYNDGIAMLYSNSLSFETHGGTWDHASVPLILSLDTTEEQIHQGAQDSAGFHWIVDFIEEELYQNEYVTDKITREDEKTRKIASLKNGLRRRTWNKCFPNHPRPDPVVTLAPREIHHYDNFLWFLATIGTRNAALLTNMRFLSLNSDEELQVLELYIIFIKVVCTGLQQLEIDTSWGSEQVSVNWARPEASYTEVPSPRSLQLTQLLPRIQSIPTLARLRVTNVIRKPVRERAGFCSWGVMEGMPEFLALYAEEAVKAVAEQSKERRRKARMDYERNRYLESEAYRREHTMWLVKKGQELRARRGDEIDEDEKSKTRRGGKKKVRCCRVTGAG